MAARPLLLSLLCVEAAKAVLLAKPGNAKHAWFGNSSKGKPLFAKWGKAKQAKEEAPAAPPAPKPVAWALAASAPAEEPVYNESAPILSFNKMIHTKVYKEEVEQVKEELEKEQEQKAAHHVAHNVSGMDHFCEPKRRSHTANLLSVAFHQLWAPTVAEAFRDLEDSTYLTVLDGRMGVLFKNWIANVKQVAAQQRSNITVVSANLDKRGHTACTKTNSDLQLEAALVNLHCVSLAGWLPKAFFEKTTKAKYQVLPAESESDEGIESCAYQFILWSKPQILQAASSATMQGVMMIDTDVLLSKNILPYAQERIEKEDEQHGTEYAIVTGLEEGGNEYRPWILSTGTVFVQQPASDIVLQRWVAENNKFLLDPRGDQTALQQVYKNAADDSESDFRYSLYTMDSNVVGHCGAAAQYATHYNCFKNTDLAVINMKKTSGISVTGGQEYKRIDLLTQKIDAMKFNKEWLLDADNRFISSSV